MKILRGSGKTFSTSGQPWFPWMTTKADRRNARLRRLVRKHDLKPLSKAEARQLCDQAVTEFAAQQRKG